MNALDQAFIKAFAKDRTPAATAKGGTTKLRAQPQPPAEGVESVSLVLHDLYEQGKRLRIDRPTSDHMGLDAHMIVPLVEHVESYHADDVPHATQPPVVFEDRLTPLDPAVELAKQTESDVKPRTEAIVDKEVPTSELPAAQVEVKREEPAAAKQESDEDRLLAQCLPQVLLAATHLDAPELMTLELGQLDQAASAELGAVTSAIEISLPQVDLDSLAASARRLEQELRHLEATLPERFAESVAVEPMESTESGALRAAAIPVQESPAPEVAIPEVAIPEVAVPEVAVPEVAVPEVVAPEVEPIANHASQPTPMAEAAIAEPRVEPQFEPKVEPIVEPIVEPMVEPLIEPFVEPIVNYFDTADLPPAPPAQEFDETVTGSAVADSTALAAGSAVTAGAAAIDDAPAAAIPFTPAWEVDAFRWPSLCQQLDDQTEGRLTESGAELFVATQDGLKVLAVTSSRRLEGRTTLALSLARTAAVAGSRVALVDADSANPELARRLGMEAPCDWREVKRRGEPLSEGAVASLDDGVTLFPRTFPTDDEVGFFDATLSSTLTELSRSFDLVVVDLPPKSPSDAISEGSKSSCPIDMAVVVRNMQATSEEQCLTTVESLRKQGVRAVGVIENFTQDADTK